MEKSLLLFYLLQFWAQKEKCELRVQMRLVIRVLCFTFRFCLFDAKVTIWAANSKLAVIEKRAFRSIKRRAKSTRILNSKLLFFLLFRRQKRREFESKLATQMQMQAAIGAFSTRRDLFASRVCILFRPLLRQFPNVAVTQQLCAQSWRAFLQF